MWHITPPRKIFASFFIKKIKKSIKFLLDAFLLMKNLFSSTHKCKSNRQCIKKHQAGGVGALILPFRLESKRK